MRDHATHMEDRLLLAAAQAGDERAFRRLVEPYRHALEVHCYRMLGSAQDTEDVVQETLLRAWRALERFQPRAQVQTWLYRIATNACLDELERRPRRPEPIDPFPDGPRDETAAPTYDPAARYAIREGMELALLRAIQELPRPPARGADLPRRAGMDRARGRRGARVDRRVGQQRAAARPRDDRAAPARAGARSRGGGGARAARSDAFERDDVDALVSLLREDAMLRMPPQPSVIGAVEVARFFRETATGGDLSRMRLTPIWANGAPAVAIHRRGEDGGLIPHGVSVLEIEGGRIVGIDAFIDPALLPRFGFPAAAGSGRSP
jgi:RNA polymerase sigma-70 factor, ECF subfamily